MADESGSRLTHSFGSALQAFLTGETPVRRSREVEKQKDAPSPRRARVVSAFHVNPFTDLQPRDAERYGVVDCFFPDGRYGFLRPFVGGADLFFYVRDIRPDDFSVGDLVSYAQTVDEQRRPHAVDISVIRSPRLGMYRRHGKVKHYNDARRFGFLSDPFLPNDVFFCLRQTEQPAPLDTWVSYWLVEDGERLRATGFGQGIKRDSNLYGGTVTEKRSDELRIGEDISVRIEQPVFEVGTGKKEPTIGERLHCFMERRLNGFYAWQVFPEGYDVSQLKSVEKAEEGL